MHIVITDTIWMLILITSNIKIIIEEISIKTKEIEKTMLIIVILDIKITLNNKFNPQINLFL